MHTPLTFNLQSVSLVIFFEQPTLYLSGRVLNETLTKKFIESIGHIDFSYKCYLVSFL